MRAGYHECQYASVNGSVHLKSLLAHTRFAGKFMNWPMPKASFLVSLGGTGASGPLVFPLSLAAFMFTFKELRTHRRDAEVISGGFGKRLRPPTTPGQPEPLFHRNFYSARTNGIAQSGHRSVSPHCGHEVSALIKFPPDTNPPPRKLP